MIIIGGKNGMKTDIIELMSMLCLLSIYQEMFIHNHISSTFGGISLFRIIDAIHP